MGSIQKIVKCTHIINTGLNNWLYEFECEYKHKYIILSDGGKINEWYTGVYVNLDIMDYVTSETSGKGINMIVYVIDYEYSTLGIQHEFIFMDSQYGDIVKVEPMKDCTHCKVNGYAHHIGEFENDTNLYNAMREFIRNQFIIRKSLKL